MRVLRATQKQYEILNGFELGPHRIEFVDSKHGWIVSADILENPYIKPYMSIFSKLEVIENYEPPTESTLWASIKSFFS